MLKQVPAKCPRRRICSGTPLQGQVRGPTDPTHALICCLLLLHVLSNNSNLAPVLQARDSNRLSQDGYSYSFIWTQR